MIYRALADAVLLLHGAFLAFVVFGGLLAARWRRVAWVHVPAFLWGGAIEFGGWICPLTPLENSLRRVGGEEGYEAGFIEHYLLPLVYPGGLTREIQIALGILALLLNAAVYAWILRRRRI